MISTKAGKKCKVLVVSQYSEPTIGGAERYMHEVTARLAVYPELIINRLSSDHWDGPGKKLSLGLFRFMSTCFHPAWFMEVPKKLETYRPDVIYAHYGLPGLVPIVLYAARKKNIPVALMYHSDITGFDYLRKTLGHCYFHLQAKRQLNDCVVIFVGTKAYVKTSPHLKKIKNHFVVAPPGVDPIMAMGKLSAGKPYILFVGKPEVPAKGFVFLNKAFRLLKKTRPGLKLVVIGGQQEHSEKQEEGIIHVGYVHSRRRLADWYASAAVTVLPGIIESFGMVLIEALIAGSPVVGTTSGGNASFIIEDENGYLCDPGDSRSLYIALKKALDNQERLRENIQARKDEYLKQFNWDSTAEIVARTLISIVKKDKE